MKKIFFLLAISVSSLQLFSQENLLTDGGFETLKSGSSSHLTRNLGAIKGKSGRWQVTMVSGNCPDSCSAGNSSIVSDVKNTGENALQINITKQTNRNDIKLFQSIKNVQAGIYEITFFAKSNIESPISIDILKSTQAAPNNGLFAYGSEIISSAAWKQYKCVVDISDWTDEERSELRISLRVNSKKTTALPTGPYPRTFWIDDVTFAKK